MLSGMRKTYDIEQLPGLFSSRRPRWGKPGLVFFVPGPSVGGGSGRPRETPHPDRLENRRSAVCQDDRGV